MLAKFPGRHGVFQFVETDNVNEKTGRKYLEPKSKAEIDFDIWIKEQNGGKQSSNEPPIGSYEKQAASNPAPFIDDVPF